MIGVTDFMILYKGDYIMTCGECGASAMRYQGKSLKDSKYTYCSERPCGTYKHGNYKAQGWTKVHKNSQPKWCPRKEKFMSVTIKDFVEHCMHDEGFIMGKPTNEKWWLDQLGFGYDIDENGEIYNISHDLDRFYKSVYNLLMLDKRYPK